jgi:hypothetical protein
MKWNNYVSLIIAICLPLVLSAQKSDKPVTISGKVLTASNMPVAGAVLYIDNIRTSIFTKSDGTYKIKVSPTALNLEVRSSDFGSAIQPINGHTTINFLLQGGKELTAAPVAPGDTAAMVEKPDSKKHRAKKMNTYNNIYEMIRCEVNGVIVSGRNIQIQQGHSFLGSSAPLFVVNGTIVQSIDNINPIEVKSIGLLKGSNAAIYGLNGSNGVISITLKNGSEKDK